MIMAIILLRVLVALAASLVAFAGGLILFGIGMPDKALSVVMTAGIVAWCAWPNPEQMAAFDQFQKQRLAKYNIEI